MLRSARNPSRRRLPDVVVDVAKREDKSHSDSGTQENKSDDHVANPNQLESLTVGIDVAKQEEKSHSDSGAQENKSDDHVANPKWSTRKKLLIAALLAVPTAIWGVVHLCKLPSHNAGTEQPTREPTVSPTQEPTSRRKKDPTSWFDVDFDLLSEEQLEDLLALQNQMKDFPNSCYLSNNGVCNEGILCPMGTDCYDCGFCYYSYPHMHAKAMDILNSVPREVQNIVDAINGEE